MKINGITMMAVVIRTGSQLIHFVVYLPVISDGAMQEEHIFL
jgi:hypothetical protein